MTREEILDLLNQALEGKMDPVLFARAIKMAKALPGQRSNDEGLTERIFALLDGFGDGTKDAELLGSLPIQNSSRIGFLKPGAAVKSAVVFRIKDSTGKTFMTASVADAEKLARTIARVVDQGIVIPDGLTIHNITRTPAVAEALATPEIGMAVLGLGMELNREAKAAAAGATI